MNTALVDLCSYLGYVCPCAAGLLLHDNSGTAGEVEEDYSPHEVRPLLQKLHQARRQHMRRGRQQQHASALGSATRRPTASSCTRDTRRLRSVSRPRLLPPPQPQLCSDHRRSASSPRATPANALPLTQSRSADADDEVVVISVFSPPREEEKEHGSADGSRSVRKSTVFTQHEDAEWNVIIAK